MTTLEYDDHHIATARPLPAGIIILAFALAAWAIILAPLWLLLH